MPDMLVGPFVSTEEIVGPSAATQVEGEKIIDMDSKIRKLDPDSTQFTTMSNKMSSRVATREKVNWLEEQYVNNVFTLTAAYTTGASVSATVSAADAASIQPNDILRNMTTGEALLVTAVNPGTGVLTCTTSVGSVVGQNGASGQKLLFVGSAFPQGSSLPNMKYSQRVLGFNYTQIFRTVWNFALTTTAIELVGGSEPAKEGARKAVEHKRELENNGFFGARDYYTVTDPQGASGGLIEFIVTNKQNVNGELTSDFLDQFLATVLAKGSSDKVIYTGTIGAYYISRFNRSGQGAFWRPGRENVHGVQVDGFLSGVYGYEVPVIVKKEWSNYPSGATGYNGNLFVVDMANVEKRPLRDRSTKLLTNRQNPGDDRYAAEYLTEQAWEIAIEKSHGLLYGIA
jgi:Family of unknown function (DUF5309)